MKKSEKEFWEMILLIDQEKDYIFVDTESTGFVPNDNWCKLLEIGAARYSKGQKVKEFSELIDPHVKISKQITDVTGITNEMVKGKRSYREVLQDFYHFCDDGEAILVFHNAVHDLRFLNYFGNKFGYEFGKKYIDTLTLSKYIVISDKGYRLENLAKLFGVDDPSHHRALNDAIVTAEVFYEILSKYKDEIESKKEQAEGIMKMLEAKKAKEDEKEPKIYNGDFEIISVNPWSMSSNKRLIQRIYVKVRSGRDYANVYYDFTTKDWHVKDTSFNRPLNMSSVEGKVLLFSNKDQNDLNDFSSWEKA